MAKRNKSKRAINLAHVSQPALVPGVDGSKPIKTASSTEAVAWIGNAIYAAVMSIVGIVLPLMGVGWAVSVVILACGAVIAIPFLRRKRHAIWLIAIMMALILVLIYIAWRIDQPTETERQVDLLMASVQTADGWAAPPIMFDESRQYLVDNFSAFDPTDWHAWDELDGNPEIDNLTDLIPNAQVFQGETVITAGVSYGGHQVGGQMLMQLEPLDHSTAQLLASNASIDVLVPTIEDKRTLASNSVESSADSHLILMCLITPRPFVDVSGGWYWVVKGTPVAIGHIFRMDGTAAQVVYMVCSSGERFPMAS